MKQKYLKLIKLVAPVLILSTAFSACASSNTSHHQNSAVIITNIADWNHPAKKVFNQHKVKLTKVLLTKHKKYATFYVVFPYDPQSSQTADYFNQLYADVLAANGWRSYALQDEQDKIRIEVNWNKSKKVMTTNYVPLQ